MVKVSIIVPVYNREKYLTNCLKSLINQNLKDIEIIIIDDGSNDNSLKIINDFAYKHPQIKVIVNDTNMGQSISRNKGMKLATGEFIGFVDSDDYISPNMYEDMYNEAVLHDVKIVSTKLSITTKYQELPTSWDYYPRCKGNLINLIENKDFLLEVSPSCCNKLFHKDIIKDLRFLDERMWEDAAFCYSAYMKVDRTVDINQFDYFYFVHFDNSVSARAYKVNPKILDIFAVFDEVFKNNKDEEFIEIIRTLATINVLQRIREVFEWNITYEDKMQMAYLLDSLLCQKYGDWRLIKREKLCTKTDLVYLDHMGFTKHQANSNDDSIPEKITKKLDFFKKWNNY